MAHTLILQPDGFYAIWSTVSDSFVLLNATEEDVVQFHLARAESDIRSSIKRQIIATTWSDSLKWNEACKEYRNTHRLPIHLNTRRVPKRRWIRRKM